MLLLAWIPRHTNTVYDSFSYESPQHCVKKKIDLNLMNLKGLLCSEDDQLLAKI